MWIKSFAWIKFLEVVEWFIGVQLNQAGAVDVRQRNFFVSGMGGIDPGVLVRINIEAVLQDVEVVSKENAWAL